MFCNIGMFCFGIIIFFKYCLVDVNFVWSDFVSRFIIGNWIVVG